MLAILRRRQESAPHLGLRPFGPGRHAMDAVGGDLADLARIGRDQPGPALQLVRVVTRQDRHVARAQSDRGHPVDLDDQLARANVMITDQLVGSREEGLEMARGEFRVHAEVAAEFPINDHPAG